MNAKASLWGLCGMLLVSLSACAFGTAEMIQEHGRQVMELRRQVDQLKLQVKAREEETKRSEEHTSELQSLAYLVCRLLLEKKKYRVLYVSKTSIFARRGCVNMSNLTLLSLITMIVGIYSFIVTLKAVGLFRLILKLRVVYT